MNHLVRPDSTIAELVLMHDEGRTHTSVRMKATHSNSLWSTSAFQEQIYAYNLGPCRAGKLFQSPCSSVSLQL